MRIANGKTGSNGLVYWRPICRLSWLTVLNPQPSDATPHHLVLIADPQLVDPHTYPGRPWPLSTLTVLHTDLYLRRSFKQIQKYLHPDTVLFLGDLFDGGREWATQETASPDDRLKKYGNKFWIKEYVRFSKLFFSQWAGSDAPGPSPAEPRGRKMIASLPGNHDLGFATGIQPAVKDRFDAYFGPLNRIDMIGNHTIISLDTVSLSAMDQADPLTGSSGSGDGTATSIANSAIWKPTSDFLSDVKDTKERLLQRELRSLANLPEQAYEMGTLSGFLPNVTDLQDIGASSLPRRNDIFQHASSSMFPTILLTHVPLFRPADTDCGPHRENGHSLSIAAGYQYQNVLTPLISKDIIAKLGAEDITQVYSGDDHDFCEIDHLEFTGKIKEITVKSMSWAMGVRKPGFLAVSLHNPIDLDLAASRNTQSETPGIDKDTVQNHLCLLPDQLSIFIRYAQLLGFTLFVLAVRAIVLHLTTTNSPTSSRRSTHSSRPLLPISSTEAYHAKASSISSSLAPEHRPSARSQSPSKATLGGYGNLPPSSRSSSPFKSDAFAPAPHAPVISVEQDESDDWGMPKSIRRPVTRRRGIVGEFGHSVWQVAWPSLVFYGWLIWNG